MILVLADNKAEAEEAIIRLRVGLTHEAGPNDYRWIHSADRLRGHRFMTVLQTDGWLTGTSWQKTEQSRYDRAQIEDALRIFADKGYIQLYLVESPIRIRK